MSPDPPIEPLGGETAFEGSQFSVRVDRFRHADGEQVQRELVRRMGAVAIVAYDDEHVWLVRQPREAILQFTLELPAGKLDEEGESPLQTARRELAEEVGQAAAEWTEVECYYSSSGYSDELVRVFAATGLRPADADADPGERIEIVRWPLADLDAALAATNDAKTIIGLQWLRANL
ncbi:MAG TPA: NUDIX hydrolase [Solirubrobacteraceae bacterium]|nr:NUDIX hydrolase [Solirubrobacteraceae bacterium]